MVERKDQEPKDNADDHQTSETVVVTDLRQTDVTTLVPAQELPNEPAPEAAEGEPKYKVIKSLGKGGFAWVYLVRNLDLDRLEAMKILNSELGEDPDVVSRFVKEARISANFNHQNIVTIFEVQQRGRWSSFEVPQKIRKRHAEPFVYFTMSFIEGETATNLIKKTGRLPQNQAISIAMDAGAALDYAHGRGVVHRDIKPDNILVDRKGNGIVMDFGIAKVADQTRQTAAGTFMGTARYVSPEQARGDEIDGRSDIYSLGIALYELVTGRVPFDSDQWMTVLYQHLNEPPPAPEQFCKEIDRDLRAIILKMLSKDKGDRFQTAGELHHALGTVYRKLGGKDRGTEALDNIQTRRNLVGEPATRATELVAPKAPTTSPPVRTQVREPRRTEPAPQPKKWPRLLAVAAVLAGLAVAVFLLLPKTPSSPDPDQQTNPFPGLQGNLLISAFPRGRLIKITDESGKPVAFGDADLPRILTLPEGGYDLVISYQGRTLERSAYVSSTLPLSKINAEFELEEDQFLLEDIR